MINSYTLNPKQFSKIGELYSFRISDFIKLVSFNLYRYNYSVLKNTMQILSYISLVIVSIYFLVRAADLIEDAFVYLAKRLRISEFFIGFVILGTISSLPELSVAINSSETIPELSVGNLLGATLIILTLVLGTASIKFGNVNFKGRFRRREMTAALLVILSSLGALADGSLRAYEGMILIFLYLILILELRERFKEKKPEELNTSVEARKVYYLLTQSLLGIVMLLIASNTVVEGVKLLGEEIKINEAIIGIFVLAVGTNTPELALLFRAKSFDQTKLAIGNFLGSVTFNTPTLGILAILSGGFEISEFETILPVMVLIAFASIMFWYFAVTDRALSKREGILLIAVFLSLIIYEAINLLVLQS